MSAQKPRAAAGAPRHRRQVLATVDTILAEVVSVGLCHSSASMAQRLRTLGVSASAVHLPRLGLALRETAEEVELLLARSARGDEARLFSVLARLSALVAALRRTDEPRPEIVGTFRTRYEDRGELVLTGLGAYHWRTGSGYRGLTLLFLDESTGSWHTWSDSRPLQIDPSFEPRRRYLEAPPWQGAGTPATASRHRLRLLRARTNPQGRLSSTARCHAQDLGPTEPWATDFGEQLFADWRALRRRAAATVPLGLSVPREQSSLVVVRPARWGQPSFDEIDQCLVVPLLDGAGDTICLRVPFSTAHALALERLETVAAFPRHVWGLCARLHLHAGGLALYPLSLLLSRPDDGGQAVVNLTLDPAPDAERLGRALNHPGQGVAGLHDGEPGATAPLPGWSAATETQIVLLEQVLQHLAESGRHALDEGTAAELARSAPTLLDLDLPILARALEDLVRRRDAPTLLRLRYLLDLHRQSAVRAGVENALPASAQAPATPGSAPPESQ